MTETLFLLPGLLCDETIWTHQVAALRERYDVRVADFTRCDAIADMARTVLDAAPDRFSVAGHSMGARVALETLRLAPGRIDRLALLDTGTHPVRAGEAEKRQALVDLADADGMAALSERWLPPMMWPPNLADETIMAPLRAMVGRMTPAIFAGQVAALLGRPNAEEVLGLVACPTLVGVGRHDAWSPLAQHEAIAAAIPQARLVVFEDSGHMAPAEAPAAVTRAMADWMAIPPA